MDLSCNRATNIRVYLSGSDAANVFRDGVEGSCNILQRLTRCTPGSLLDDLLRGKAHPGTAASFCFTFHAMFF